LKEKYKRHTKIYTDGSQKEEKDRYAVVWEKQTIKRKIHSQNSIYSADQSAIINVIYNTWRRRTEGYIHGQMMAVSD
jgi:homospermidine synthase